MSTLQRQSPCSIGDTQNDHSGRSNDRSTASSLQETGSRCATLDSNVADIICATMYVNNPNSGILMNTRIWLRVSAIISLLFTAGHFMGGLQNWSPMADNPVLQSMRTVRFDVMGVNRSYLDLYMGLGHSLTVSLLLQSVLLWILSNVARRHASLVRPMIAAFVLAVALTGVIAWRYILPVPAFFSLALCATLVVAFIAAQRSSTVSALGNRE